MQTMPSTENPDQISLLVQAAELYYELNLTQAQVAARLGVSRPTVSRLLRQARERDIVRIEIVHPASLADSLQREMVARWDLHDAVVVPTTVGQDESLLHKLGHAAARYVEQHLPPGAHLGVGLGQTVYQFVHSLNEVHRNPHVVPLCGGTVFSASAYHVNEIARIAAQKLAGYCHYLHAPSEVARQEVYDALLADNSVAHVVEMWERLDWAVVGIGSAEHAEAPEFRKIIAQAVEAGCRPVADVCQRLVDDEGNVCDVPERQFIIAVGVEQLRRAGRVVAVAGGAHKAPAIVAALKTEAIDVLLVDEPTAVAVLQTPEA